MPRISAKRMQDRRESLVEAARTVFAQKGYEGSAISDIAQVAGVSDGLFYRYFASKRELLLAVLHDFYERVIDELEEAVAQEQAFEARLATLIHEHIAVFVSDVDLCRLFIAEVRNFSDYVGSETHELNRRYTSVLMRIIADGVAEGQIDSEIDPRIIRDMLFGGIEHLAWRHIVAGQAIDDRRIAGQVSRLMLAGLSPRSSP